MSLYDNDFIDYENEKKPTLRQYLKAKKGKNIPKKFLIVTIWRPNKYPSFGIETEHFRATVGKDTPIGRLLQDNWSEIVESDTGTFIGLQREGESCKGMRFYPSTEKGMWMDIGDSPLLGIRWKTD